MPIITFTPRPQLVSLQNHDDTQLRAVFRDQEAYPSYRLSFNENNTGSAAFETKTTISIVLNIGLDDHLFTPHGWGVAAVSAQNGFGEATLGPLFGLERASAAGYIQGVNRSTMELEGFAGGVEQWPLDFVYPDSGIVSDGDSIVHSPFNRYEESQQFNYYHWHAPDRLDGVPLTGVRISLACTNADTVPAPTGGINIKVKGTFLVWHRKLIENASWWKQLQRLTDGYAPRPLG